MAKKSFKGPGPFKRKMDSNARNFRKALSGVQRATAASQQNRPMRPLKPSKKI